MEAGDDETYQRFGDYLEAQERLRTVDERMHFNVMSVEKDLYFKQESVTLWEETSKQTLQSLNGVMLSLVEQQEKFEKSMDGSKSSGSD